MTDRPTRPPGSPVRRPPAPETVDRSGGPSKVPSADESNPLPQAGPDLQFGKVPADLPAQFGRYRLERVLGKGGMGAVYLAYDSRLDRRVALKVPRFSGDEEEMRERFLREGRAAATVRHPNLCPVYDIGEHDGVYYLTMAYIEGKPLSDYLRGEKPIAPLQAARLVRVLAKALQEAHDHGIIHRDLKPGNILISRKKEPIITDFGLARRGASGDARLTQSGEMMGTPAYMPPEQVNGDVAAMGPGCDIYSLGVILYQLLANRRPFDGPRGVLLAQIMLDPPPPPRQFRPELDPALEAICLRALAKQPGDRYPSMRVFAGALESWLAGEASPPPHADSPPSTAAEEPPQAGTVRETAAATTARRPIPLTRRPAKRRARGFRLTSGQQSLLVVCTILLLTCGLPVAAIVIVVCQTVNKVTDGVSQAGQWVSDRQKEAKQEQERLKEERRKESAQWEEAARTWRPPPADAGPARLFPATIGAYKRTAHDDRANVADLDVAAPGWRAVYRGPAGAVELFAYKTTKPAKEAIFRGAQGAVNRRGRLPAALGAGSPSVRGSVFGTYLAYDLGSGANGAEQYGVFWWQPDWLFLARGTTAEVPASFLKAYLAELGPNPGGAPVKPRGP
jgi:predicted Ser/Thr protein kinase